jgi:arginine repressor
MVDEIYKLAVEELELLRPHYERYITLSRLVNGLRGQCKSQSLHRLAHMKLSPAPTKKSQIQQGILDCIRSSNTGFATYGELHQHLNEAGIEITKKSLSPYLTEFELIATDKKHGWYELKDRVTNILLNDSIGSDQASLVSPIAQHTKSGKGIDEIAVLLGVPEQLVGRIIWDYEIRHDGTIGREASSTSGEAA